MAWFYDDKTKSQVEFLSLEKIPGSGRKYKAIAVDYKTNKLVEVGVLDYNRSNAHKKAIDNYFYKRAQQKKFEYSQRKLY